MFMKYKKKHIGESSARRKEYTSVASPINVAARCIFTEWRNYIHNFSTFGSVQHKNDQMQLFKLWMAQWNEIK